MKTSKMPLIIKWISSWHIVILMQSLAMETTAQNGTVPTNISETYDAIIKDEDDAAIYEVDNFKQHLQNAELKSSFYEGKLNNTLRYLSVDKYEAADVRYMYFANISMGLMQQSVYSTRVKLQKTRRFRQIFADDPAYRAGMIYVTLLALRTKMDNIFATMRNMKSDGNFIHVLILYERMVVASVDVETFVNQMFEIQEYYKQVHLRRE